MIQCIHGQEAGTCTTCRENLRISTEKRTAPLIPYDGEYKKAIQAIHEKVLTAPVFPYSQIGMIVSMCFDIKEVKDFFGSDTGLELSYKKLRIREFIANWIKFYISTPTDGN